MHESIRISLIQTNLYLNKNENFYHFDRLIDQLEETDIILFPEMFNTSFCPRETGLAETMQGETIKWMKKKAIDYNCSIVGSLMIKEKEKVFNRLVWVTQNKQIFKYDKRHLFPLVNEEKHLTSGEKRLIIKEKGWKICPQICYDLRFPIFSRNNVDYDILIYVSNWPETRIESWKTLLKARAIENQCYTIGLNRIGKDKNNINFSGESMIIDANGEVLNSISVNKEKTETIIITKKNLEKIRNKYPFLKDRDKFTLR